MGNMQENLNSNHISYATYGDAHKIGLGHLSKNNNIYRPSRVLRLMLLYLVTSLLVFNSQTSQAKEALLKASLLYRIASFIEWHPEVNIENLKFCTVGRLDAVFLDALKRFKTKQAVLNFLLLENVEVANITECNIVFISQGAAQNAAEIIRTLAGQPVLTVGEMDGFIEMGGMIDISARRMNHIEPIINRDRIHCSGLQVSSRLLKVYKRSVIQKDKRKINCDEIIPK